MFKCLEHEPVRKMFVENLINLVKVIFVMGLAFWPLAVYIYHHPL